MIDTTAAPTPHVYAAEAYREQIDPPRRRRWWQRAKNPQPPTGAQRERFLISIRVEELGEADSGRRMCLTPFGPLATIIDVGAFITENDGAMISVYTHDCDYYLPVGTVVYLSPPSRGLETRLPAPPLLERHGAWIDPSLRLPDDFPRGATSWTRNGRTYDVVEHTDGHRYGVPR